MAKTKVILHSLPVWPFFGFMTADAPALRARIAQVYREGNKRLGVYDTQEQASLAAQGMRDDRDGRCSKHQRALGSHVCDRCASTELTDRLAKSVAVVDAIRAAERVRAEVVR